MSFDPQQFIATAPDSPGVYRMLDGAGTTLYVGKAASLKKRLASYFGSRSQAVKTRVLLEQVADIAVTITHTEGEALLMENDLIKSLQPRYNILLRDDKSYPCIVVTMDHRFPRIGFFRGRRVRGHKYFGPYSGAGAVRETLALLQKVFPVRQCEDGFFRNRSRPCLQYQIKRCTAPCVGLVDSAQYQEDLEQAILFLEGRSRLLTDTLVARMEQASQAKEFERAARYRDRIGSLRRVLERATVAVGLEEVDIVAVAGTDSRMCVEMICIRDGRNAGNRSFFPKVGLQDRPQDVLAAFLAQHYLGRSTPREILLSMKIADRALLAGEFSRQCGHGVKIISPQRGDRARWVELARLNAGRALERRALEHGELQRQFSELGKRLGLAHSPARIECVDVSHTFGEATVGSCVVFDVCGAATSDYRRYNIADVTPGDDYGALRQLLVRRCEKAIEAGNLPDLMLIDGGKGQLEVALEVFQEYQASGVPLAAVAKGAARRAGEERIFLPGRRQPIILPADCAALHLVQKIRDEAHRFAITGHRQRRAKARTRSVLEEIPGVGVRRRRAMLRNLGGLQEVARAGVEELARVPGISAALARRVYDVFHE